MAPARMSPAANTPGTLVSRDSGSRCSFQTRAYAGSASRSRPVRTNPFGVAQHLGGEPVASWLGSDEHEHRVDILHLTHSIVQSERDAFHVAPPFDTFDLRPGTEPNVRGLFDLIDEVLRHGVAQGIAAHDDLHVLRRSAPGTWPPVPPSCPRRRPHAPAGERRRFCGGRAIVDARARVLRHSRRRMFSVHHASRGQHGSCDELTTIAERKALVSRVDRRSGHFDRHENFRAEALRLHYGATCQIAAADAGWKPEIVLNPGAAACLPAGRVSIE